MADREKSRPKSPLVKLKTNKLVHYAFRGLAELEWMRHAVFSRKGPNGADWSLSLSQSSDPGKVSENLSLIESAIGIGPLSIVGQVHGTEALFLSPGEVYAPKIPSEVRSGYDAIVGGPGQALMVRLADCQGIILADPQTRTVAVVHSGWRGTAANIVGKTLEKLAKRGADPERIFAGVGPSLGPCCAEMVNYKKELPEELWEFKAFKPNHFDFWAMTKRQLEAAGVPPENIEIARICTKCHPDFYSYRRGDKGRFGVIAGAMT